MRHTPRTGLKSRQTKKQVTAIAFLACFIVASLLSGAFVLTHADHTHDHKGIGGTCATCAQVQNAENLLRQINMAVVGVFFSLAGLFAVSVVVRAACSNITVLTLITARTRMNN